MRRNNFWGTNSCEGQTQRGPTQIGVKLVIAMLFATNATLNPFLTLVLQDYGFSTIGVGRLISISKVFSLFLSPAVCTIADIYDCQVPVLFVLALSGSAVMLFWYWLIPLLHPPPKGNETNEFMTAPFLLTGCVLTFYATAYGSKSVITDALVLTELNAAANQATHQPPSEGHSDPGNVKSGEYSTIALPIGSTGSDAGRSSHKRASDAYPLQRLWGSVSYGVVAFATGSMVSVYAKMSPSAGENSVHSTTQHKDKIVRPFCIATLLHSTAQVLFGVTVLYVMRHRIRSTFIPATRQRFRSSSGACAPSEPNSTVDAPDQTLVQFLPCDDVLGHDRAFTVSTAPKVMRYVRMRETLYCDYSSFFFFFTLRVYYWMLRNPRTFFTLVLGVFFLSLCENVAQAFLFPYVRNALKAPPEIFSLIILMHMLGEVVAFMCSSLVLRYYGRTALFIVAALASATKMAAYSRITHVWWFVPVECLHGLSISFSLAATVSLTNLIVHETEQRLKDVHDTHLFHSDRDLGKYGRWEGAHEDAAVDTRLGCRMQFKGSVPHKKGEIPSVKFPTVNVMSMAFAMMWFVIVALPGVVAGQLPAAELWWSVEPAVPVMPDVVPKVLTVEQRLFHKLSIISLGVACAFAVYARRGWT